jgi:hypothetical protein
MQSRFEPVVQEATYLLAMAVLKADVLALKRERTLCRQEGNPATMIQVFRKLQQTSTRVWQAGDGKLVLAVCLTRLEVLTDKPV